MHTHLRTLMVGTIPVMMGLVPTDAQAQEASRIAGTFVLNRAASMFGPDGGARRMVRTYEDRGDGVVHATFEGVNAAGNPTFTQYAAKHDSQEYPWLLRGAEGAGTIALTRVDAYSSTWMVRVDGEVTARGESAISRDGQTYTQTSRGVGSDALEVVQMFDRR